jgi:hypothetical protein
MAKNLLPLLLLLSMHAHAETFNTKVSASKECMSAETNIQFMATLKAPDELRFLVGEVPSFQPLAAFVDNKEFQDETFSGEKKSIRITTPKGKFYTYTSPGEIRLLLTAAKNVFCDTTSSLSFVYSLVDSKGKPFGFVKLSVVSEDLQTAELVYENRIDVIKEINRLYLSSLQYYMDDNFEWSNIEKSDENLIRFFSTVNAKYILNTREIEGALTNSLFKLEFKENKMRVHYGGDGYLEFVSSKNKISVNDNPNTLTLNKVQLNLKP